MYYQIESVDKTEDMLQASGMAEIYALYLYNWVHELAPDIGFRRSLGLRILMGVLGIEFDVFMVCSAQNYIHVQPGCREI